MYKFSNITHLIILGCLCLIISGCTYAPYRYSFSLVKPESETLNFEDSNVQFIFVLSPEKISVEIRNKTDRNIELVGNKAEFIDHQGESHTVLYGNDFYNELRFYADNGEYVAPMRIVPGSAITGHLWINTFLDITLMKDWRRVKPVDIDNSRIPFFPKNSFEGRGKKLIGSTFRLILPIDFDGRISNYMFTFKIDDVIE